MQKDIIAESRQQHKESPGEAVARLAGYPAEADEPKTTFSFVVNLEGSLVQYGPDIRRFVDAMVYKLGKNAHKGRWEDLSAVHAFGLLEKEVAELREELFESDGRAKQPNMIAASLEAADIANFALIVAAILMERGR